MPGSAIQVTRRVRLPDPLKLARFLRAPELGPRLLFFSGGSALAALSRALIRYTHNSIHLITPFDSGGSSAKLRQAFHMPAVGDLRNRLMALSDQSIQGNPEVRALFTYRFPKDEDNEVLHQRLQRMCAGRDPLVAAVPDPLRKIIRTHLKIFLKAKPEGFPLGGASIGNLVLTGGYLNNDRRLDPVVYLFGKLAEARGVVRAIVNQDLHLVADLADGTRLVGQHLITGRESAPITSPVERLFLTDDPVSCTPARPVIRQKTMDLIQEADLICYPMGSFYSSLIANLLPGGVVESVAGAACPKVYIPNTGEDHETPGGNVEASARTLIRYLLENPGISQTQALQFIVIDSRSDAYARRPDPGALRALGLTVIDIPLVTKASHPNLDPERLAELLLSLAG